MNEKYRQEGFVVVWIPAEHRGMLETYDGTKIRVLQMDVPYDEIGRAILHEGEVVSWTLGQTLEGKPKAINLRFENRKRTIYNSEQYEEVVIREMNRVTGFAIRACGTELFFHESEMDVADEFREQALADLKPGTKLWTKVKPPRVGGRSWSATDFYIID